MLRGSKTKSERCSVGDRKQEHSSLLENFEEYTLSFVA